MALLAINLDFNTELNLFIFQAKFDYFMNAMTWVGFLVNAD